MQIDINGSMRKSYEIDKPENRQIFDIDIYQEYLCVLYNKNEIQVFNLVTKEKVLRTFFKDTSSDTHITKIFYVSSFD
jgi:hypothetical protein